ncbi:transcriptional regulator [Bordetella bronchiseptica]|nr:transcriptional regulator [Bordetella bronchiseptica]
MRLAFDDCLLDLDRRELTRASRAVATAPQVFDLLAYLLANRERVVDRDELIQAVWNGRIVSESTLASHINAVRTAVGDSGQRQAVVRTVPRKGFRFVAEVRTDAPAPAGMARTPAPPATAPALPAKPSIAVLPFVNLSADPEQDYLADGVVEDIIAALSQYRWLFVVARNSSFTYKGRAVNVRQVGRELGVRYVLEGSWRKERNRVRITGQLIDAASGAHHWADRYEGVLDDIFALQDQITENVVGAIAPQLERAEIERARRKPTDSLDAYDYYLRGMACAHQGTRQAAEQALPLFHRAIACDPEFAPAYAMAAWCHCWRKVNGWMQDKPREMAEGARLARRAVELDRIDAVALTRSGHALGHLAGDLQGGIALLDRALVLKPQPGRGLVPERVPAPVARRDRAGRHALHPRHAPEPAGPRAVPDAGRHGGGASLPGASRRRNGVGRTGVARAAQLPDGGRHCRGRPCPGRPRRPGTARHGPVAPARSRLAAGRPVGMAADPQGREPRHSRPGAAPGGPA